MKNGNISLKAKCKKCDKNFDLNNDNTFHKKKFLSIEGKSIYLTYYVCPYCGTKHFVQIDDDDTLKKLDTVSKSFVQLSVKRCNDESISKKQLTNFKKIRKDLFNCRNKLMNKYEGKTVFDKESNDCFTLYFTR